VAFQSLPEVFPDLGDARLRRIVGLSGGEVESDRAILKLPDAWVREQQTSTIIRPMRIGLLVAVIAAALALAFGMILSGHRSGSVRWRPAFAVGGVVFVLNALSSLNSFPTLAAQYPTAIPWTAFAITSAATLGLGAVLVGGLALLATVFLQAAFPNLGGALRQPARRALGADGLAAAGALTGWMLVVGWIGAWLQSAFPRYALPSGVSLPSGGSGAVPLATAVYFTVQTGAILIVALAVVWVLLQIRHRLAWLKTPGVLLAAVALLPLAAKTAPELALAAVPTLLRVAGIVLIVRFVFRDNPWAYILGGIAGALISTAGELLRSGVAAWVYQGAALVLIFVVVAVVLIYRPPRRAVD